MAIGDHSEQCRREDIAELFTNKIESLVVKNFVKNGQRYLHWMSFSLCESRALISPLSIQNLTFFENTIVIAHRYRLELQFFGSVG